MKLNVPPYQVQTAVPAYQQVADYLEQQILKGTLPPATRLPPAADLAREWNTGYQVVHKALARLARTGLVERKPQRGTFVRQWQGESAIGILVDVPLSWESAHIYRKLVQVIEEAIAQMGTDHGAFDRGNPLGPTDGTRHSASSDCFRWISRAYDGIEVGIRGDPLWNRTCQRLTHDLSHYSFKGWVILGTDADSLPCSEQIGKIPSACLRYDDRSDVRWDTHDFIYQSVKYLAQHGRKRICYLRPGPLTSSEQGGWEQAVREFGPLKIISGGFERPSFSSLPRPENTYTLERETTAFTCQLVERWMRTSQWADGLVVWDDIGMRAVALALLKMGVSVPQQIMVVSYANEGIHHNYGIPVVRYEYPISDAARHLVRILWERMNGRSAVPLPIVIRGKIVPEDHAPLPNEVD